MLTFSEFPQIYRKTSISGAPSSSGAPIFRNHIRGYHGKFFPSSNFSERLKNSGACATNRGFTVSQLSLNYYNFSQLSPNLLNFPKFYQIFTIFPDFSPNSKNTQTYLLFTLPATHLGTPNKTCANKDLKFRTIIAISVGGNWASATAYK
jgi:hypothetical protein